VTSSRPGGDGLAAQHFRGDLEVLELAVRARSDESLVDLLGVEL